MFLLTYAYYFQVNQNTKPPPFSLETIWLPLPRIAIVCPMQTDVGEIHAPLAYRIRLIHISALLRIMADTNSTKTLVRYKKTTINMFRSSVAFHWATSYSLNRPNYFYLLRIVSPSRDTPSVWPDALNHTESLLSDPSMEMSSKIALEMAYESTG